jgi:benzoyl-CoA reductase subunit C
MEQPLLEHQLFPLDKITSLEEIVKITQEMMEDLTFHKQLDFAEKTGCKIIGYFPVYVPKELIESFGMLPVALYGGGEILEISHSEAYLGSFICSISKSTLELGLIGNIKQFNGFISPYICDVARNLAGIFERNFPDISSHMMHYPQNFNSKGTIPYLMAEYKRLIKKFEKITGSKFSPEKLKKQIDLSNKILAQIKEIDIYRIDNPGRISISEFYYLLRLRGLLPDSEYQKVLELSLIDIKKRTDKRRDFTKAIVMGPFCEQPTVEIIQLIEDVGFHIMDSDFQIGQRFLTGPISTEVQPLEALTRGYIEKASPLPTRHNPLGRENEVLHRIDSSGAQAVIFLTAKFCEPALEDFVLYKEAIEKHRNHIQYIHIEFEERSSNFEDVRLQLETLIESILFD